MLNYSSKVQEYFKSMAELFLQKKEKTQNKSSVSKKRQCFQVQIRNKEKQQRKKQLRCLNLSIGSYIRPLVSSLPKTYPEILTQLIENPQYHQLISKLIIALIYETQLLPQSLSSEKYHLLPLQPPNSVQQLHKELFLFMILLQNQGIHAPQILKRYFSLLKSHAQSNKLPHLLFDLINVIIKQRQLNWIAQNQIVQIIRIVQDYNSPERSKEQVEFYFNLSKNYYSFVKNTPQIKNRIKKILENGSECFKSIKPKLFFKLCMVLTYQQGAKPINEEENDKQKIQEELFFHKSMLQGSLIKNLYRQIFYSSDVKLRILCLNILGNLMIQLNSSFIWMQQKTNPIENFQNQIRDKANSMRIFYAFSEAFLLSISNIPCNELSKVLEGEVESLKLMMYILENVEENSENGKNIINLAEECLWLILENGKQEIKEKVANILIERDWKRVLGDDSELIFHCYKVLNIQL